LKPKSKSLEILKSEDHVLSVVEKWALKKCETDEKAAAIVDKRIERLSAEIRSIWTVSEEKLRRVSPKREYLAPSYRVDHRGTKHDRTFNPEGHRQ